MQPLGADEPTVMGPYRLLGRLGAGGMGRVYLGRSAGGRTVAVKIVHPHFALDEEFRARFRREVEAARRVGGAWTAPVLDADPGAPVPWVATAYAAGPSLTSAVASVGPLPAHSVRTLGAGLAEALTAVHELGLVHRDVKPSNVLLTLDGPLLIDFGIARATEGTASLTATGVSVGSPGYMAPEQILGKGATGAADVFSLGAVLAYAATGEPPFSGDSSAALLYKVVHEEPQLTGLEGTLGALVAECLAKDPGVRPTPAGIAARLAPDGAARLVAGGWLPGPLVEQVSRSAVQLLNLEAGEGAGAVASGPVGFSSPAVGEFGPAPTMGTTVGSGPQDGVPAAFVGGGGPSGPMPSPPTSVPSPSSPSTSVPFPSSPSSSPPPSGRGRVSVSVAAGTTTGPVGRGRRLSCTLALGVAAALAAVTLGSAFVFDLLPGQGSRDTGAQDGRDSTGDPAATPSSSPTGTDPEAGAGQGSGVPERYLGTWEGQGSAQGLPMGTFRVVLKQAEIGGDLGEVRQTDLLGGVCVDELSLKSASATEVVAEAKGADDNPVQCSPTPHMVTLTPTGDDVTYTSDSEDSGKPTARLSKAG
ncbi:serine/threonine-protein kinase [Streptomyces sp. NPDC093252]|uniref:serine/threonine-protein kinase n=1 Tax=Streptomyces sp. NPDC093252 TaxID=3154980 RepID=UPI00341FACCD